MALTREQVDHVTNAGRAIAMGGIFLLVFGVIKAVGSFGAFHAGHYFEGGAELAEGVLLVVTSKFLRSSGDALKAAGKSGATTLAALVSDLRGVGNAFWLWAYAMIAWAAIDIVRVSLASFGVHVP